MATITGFTADRMKQIEDTTVVSGLVDANGDLILSRRDDEEINAGRVMGPKGLGETPTGSILPYGSDTLPEGYLWCDGTSYLVADYPLLFNAIHYQFGGSNGNFNVPDMRGRVPIGYDSSTEFPYIGSSFGEKNHLLTIEEMAEHNHAASGAGRFVTTDRSGSVSKGAAPSITTSTWTPRYGTSETQAYVSNTQTAGGNLPHNNLQPSTAVNYIIKYMGTAEPENNPISGPGVFDNDVHTTGNYYANGSIVAGKDLYGDSDLMNYLSDNNLVRPGTRFWNTDVDKEYLYTSVGWQLPNPLEWIETYDSPGGSYQTASQSQTLPDVPLNEVMYVWARHSGGDPTLTYTQSIIMPALLFEPGRTFAHNLIYSSLGGSSTSPVRKYIVVSSINPVVLTGHTTNNASPGNIFSLKKVLYR